MRTDSVEISGVWLRRIGFYAEVLVERNDKWYVVAREHMDGSFSHIVEMTGILKSPEDKLGE